MKKIAVLGADGQLGSELCRQLAGNAIGLGRAECDLLTPGDLRDTLERVRSDCLVNAAAFTQVDAAERNCQACFQVNAEAVRHLAEICGEIGCELVQISTDYVFGAASQRTTPYREEDVPGPLNEYGKSKLAGERYAAQLDDHLIVRTCGLFGLPGADRQPANFVETILRLGAERDQLTIVDDQQCTITYTRHLAAAILFLIGRSARGTYHVVNSGSGTWFDFAEEIVRQSGLEVAVNRTTSAEFNAVATRPAFSVLDTSKYQALNGPPMPEWRVALKEYLLARTALKVDRGREASTRTEAS